MIEAADETEAADFHIAARAAGAICSAIDRPSHGDVQFGSIVNRSPVVVGISTDGAAPVLAQAVRRRIETLLPATLGAWAAAAKRIRKTLANTFAAPSQRRAFWQRLAERAFIEPTVPADADLLRMQPIAAGGHVTLVGAGPGDAELLTLKAMRALQAADVILFDDLVSDGVLDLARREAKRMMVGKRGGRASCRQDDINALMIKLARQGKRVVRLKSGDPMVFGRAGRRSRPCRSGYPGRCGARHYRGPGRREPAWRVAHPSRGGAFGAVCHRPFAAGRPAAGSGLARPGRSGLHADGLYGRPHRRRACRPADRGRIAS